jgi:hypothetical protein
VRYFEGFNLNYEITEEQASSFLPSRQFTPMKLKIVQDTGKRRTKRNHGAYLISWYIAVIAVEFGGTEWLITRGDLFTHAFDGSGEPTLILLAALAEVPPALLQLPPDAADAAAHAYKEALESISLDSRTGEPAHPIILGREFNFHNDGFEGHVGDEVFRLQTSCNGAGERTTSFTRAFIIANSQVFRSPIDKNVNFFNKDFIDAAVRDLPTECVSVEYPDSLAALLPTGATLVSVQAYGSTDDAISWHYEDETQSRGTPYFTVEERDERISFKWREFSNIWSQRANAVIEGTAETLLKIENRNMLYINWVLSEDGAEKIAEDLKLAENGFSLATMRLRPEDEERYLLTLNVYEAEFVGIPGASADDVRFEFSVYVTSARNPLPHFMIIQALSSIDTLDPINGQVPADGITFTVSASSLVASVIDGWQINLPIHPHSPRVVMDKDWIMATDVVTWQNGVADKVFYDGNFLRQSPILLDTSALATETQWSQYLDASIPATAFLFLDPMDFVVMPWQNLQDESLQLSEERRGELQGLKSFSFGGLANLQAGLIGAGQQEPLVDVTVYGEYPDTPRMLLNFRIPERSIPELERVIGLPDEYRLAPMATTTASKPRYMMTVAVFAEQLAVGDAFYKAAWTVYISDETGNVFLNEFHVETSVAQLNIEDITTAAAEEFTVTETHGYVKAVIKGESIEATFHVPLVGETGTRIGLSDEWVDAHEKVFWKKGVFDTLFYNGDISHATVLPVPCRGTIVSQITPWSAFVKEDPFEVLFFDGDVTFISSPWFNIEEL